MNLAIIGASGNVGRKTIEILEKSNLSFNNLYLVASTKSSGKKIPLYDLIASGQRLYLWQECRRNNQQNI